MDEYRTLEDKKNKIERLQRANKHYLFFFFMFSIFSAIDFYKLNICSGLIDTLLMGLNLFDVYANNKAINKLLEEIENDGNV